MRNKLILYSVLAAVILLAAVMGYRGFMHSHDTTWDENIYMYLGGKLAADPFSYNPSSIADSFRENNAPVPAYLNEPLFKHPPLFPYLIAAVSHLTGSPLLAAFYVSLVSGICIVIAVFFIGKEVFGSRAGALAALLATVDPIRLTCSVKMWPDSTLAALMLASLLYVIKAVRRDSARAYVIAGIFAGLAMLVKYTALLIFPAGLLMLLVFNLPSIRGGRFLLWPAAAFAVFLPWLILNLQVYGAGFVPNMARLHGVGPFFIYNFTAAAAVIAAACFAASKLHEKIRYLLVAAALIWVFRLPYVSRALAGMFDVSFIPSHGWISGMFSYEPRLFYARRLIELSPFFFVSFLGTLLIAKPKHRSFFILMPALLTLVFYILWGSYQSRYLLFASPLLMIAASYVIISLRDRIAGAVIPRSARTTLYAALAAAVIFFFVKTIYVDISIALVNDLAYF
ncbi:MAG: glycosyltransferase family 39 protein [Candidatus Omnitrophica bacterium]|nr:glycosyltransferase family 39 protein [Candidatus Omnitrophota bacterium]MDD5737070.1 glycosyltransferase family 39 protein [Candidatus Omnitrophota bacterium]